MCISVFFRGRGELFWAVILDSLKFVFFVVVCLVFFSLFSWISYCLWDCIAHSLFFLIFFFWNFILFLTPPFLELIGNIGKNHELVSKVSDSKCSFKFLCKCFKERPIHFELWWPVTLRSNPTKVCRDHLCE